MGLLLHKGTVVNGGGLIVPTNGLEETSDDVVATAAMTAGLKTLLEKKASKSDLGGVRLNVTDTGILQIIYDDGTTEDVPTT